MKRALPNLLTAGRLVLAAAVFALLAAGLPRLAFAAFMVAAATDFFDGALARRWRVTSLLGAILDPIADKVLVCAAILGLALARPSLAIGIPGATILFREFAVSALREAAAGRGARLAVTGLAKWKTTVQLVALAAEMACLAWALAGRPRLVADALLGLAAVLTVITGVQYALTARRALT